MDVHRSEEDDVPHPAFVGAGDALDWTPPIHSLITNLCGITPVLGVMELLCLHCASLKHTCHRHLRWLSWLIVVLANSMHLHAV